MCTSCPPSLTAHCIGVGPTYCLQSSVRPVYYFYTISIIVEKFTDEQYTTVNQSTAGRFNPRVFVNCLQAVCRICKQLIKTLSIEHDVKVCDYLHSEKNTRALTKVSRSVHCLQPQGFKVICESSVDFWFVFHCGIYFIQYFFIVFDIVVPDDDYDQVVNSLCQSATV